MTEFHIERDESSAEFFDAARDGRLLVRRCPACARGTATMRFAVCCPNSTRHKQSFHGEREPIQ